MKKKQKRKYTKRDDGFWGKPQKRMHISEDDEGNIRVTERTVESKPHRFKFKGEPVTINAPVEPLNPDDPSLRTMRQEIQQLRIQIEALKLNYQWILKEYYTRPFISYPQQQDPVQPGAPYKIEWSHAEMAKHRAQ